MPTAGLTGEGLKKYQRWLAVQRAKGREPSQNEIQSFLQSEIQANIATDLDRQRVNLQKQGLDIQRGELENITRRTDLLEKQQKNLEGAATISGISELAKTVGTVNTITGGAITEGLKYAGSSLWDYLAGDEVASTVSDSAMDYLYDFGTEAGITEAAVSGASFAGDEIISDAWDWTDLF